MNYLGTEPTGYKLEPHAFLIDMEFIPDCLCAGRRRAKGDNLLNLTTRNGHFRTKEVIPTFPGRCRDPVGKRGLLPFRTQRVEN